jgi:hypothetical protein
MVHVLYAEPIDHQNNDALRSALREGRKGGHSRAKKTATGQ